jgi:hypothetical protein
MREKMKLFWLLQNVIALWILAGCSLDTESRHRTIIYDEAWSRVAAVKNLSCVPELRAACEREAKKEEWTLSQKLPAIFKAEPQCRNVQFIMSKTGASDVQALQKRLESSVGFEYWRLRVDFRPRLKSQPWDLGPGVKSSFIAGGGIEEEAAYICQAVKNNGVVGIG